MAHCTILLLTATLIITTWACPPDQLQNGCKLTGRTCICGYGCRNEYIYTTRRRCYDALRGLKLSTPTPPVISTPQPTPRGTSPNSCSHAPCVRGICIQTTDDKGFTCKCTGTGFYGQRCERACPTIPMRGMTFPYECIVI